MPPALGSSDPKGPKEWTTPRKGRVLYDALHFNGSVRKLTKERLRNGVDWPSRSTLVRWLDQYHTLQAAHPLWTEIQLLDEASRRQGRTNRSGRPRKLSENDLNDMANGPRSERHKTLDEWMEKTGVSRSTIKRAQKKSPSFNYSCD
jgi:hypothetical protein